MCTRINKTNICSGYFSYWGKEEGNENGFGNWKTSYELCGKTLFKRDYIPPQCILKQEDNHFYLNMIGIGLVSLCRN